MIDLSEYQRGYRAGLEEAAKAAESAYVVVQRTNDGEIRQSVGGTAAAAIRALIEKEPAQ